MEPNKYWLGIKLIPELRKKELYLFKELKSPKTIYETTARKLKTLGFTPDEINKISQSKSNLDLNEQYTLLTKQGIGILSVSDKNYPALLKEIYDPPTILFYKGNLIKNLGLAVAIVGSRKASHYGKAIAESLASQLSEAGITTISGAARGIDSFAHKGALNKKGLTIGVLGSGLNRVYPPENDWLYEAILKAGSLVTEYLPDEPPFKSHFPARNRIISGLCQATIVVEAAAKSGALITADFALEQGREVFAIPGDIRNSLSEGCHGLIKQGAQLFGSIDDLADCIKINIEQKQPSRPDYSEKELLVIDALSDGLRHSDEIASKTKLTAEAISSTLIVLETRGAIKRDLSGSYYLL